MYTYHVLGAGQLNGDINNVHLPCVRGGAVQW